MSKQKTVLIVEDEQILQDVYKLVLTSAGYKVHTADNGVEGLSVIKKVHPDLVLLDIFMPVMDGKEFLRNIDTGDFPKTKIVVYTNMYDKATEQEMKDLGADDFILKSSIGPDDLIKLVASHLIKSEG
jgi:two-component system alkaline phosphatase synthesis response regulator PhoP